MKQLWEPLPEELHSFVNFSCYLLREQGLADAPTKQQCAVAQWMQHGPDRSLTVAFRGLGKSLLASYYALWRLRMDPNEKILVVSATALKAADFTSFCLKTISEVDILQVLTPGISNRQSNIAFDVGPATVEQSPSMRGMGVSSQTTGQRCSSCVLDDIEVLANVITQLKQERVAHAVTEIESIIKPDEGQLLPRKILYLGTPHTEASIYLRLVRERGYASRYFPAQYPDDFDPYDGNLCPQIQQEVIEDPSLVGEPTDPERFCHEDILKRQSSMTKSAFELQFMLNTRLATLDKYPIRLGDLIVTDLTGDALPETIVWSNQPDMRLQDVVCVGMGADCFYHRPIFINGWISKREAWRCVLAIDPAGRGADELAWTVMAEYGGNLFLLENGGTTLGYADEVLEHLAKTAKKWDVSYVISESNMGDGMFTQLLKPHLMKHHPCTVDEVRNSQRKEQRIADVLAPVIQQHRLVVNTRVIKNDYRLTDEDPEHGYQRSLFFQLSRLIAGEKGCLSKDDRIDSLAIAAGYFVEATAQDADRTAQQRAAQLDAEAMEAWMDETGAHVDALCLGWKPSHVGTNQIHGGVTPLTVGGK